MQLTVREIEAMRVNVSLHGDHMPEELRRLTEHMLCLHDIIQHLSFLQDDKVSDMELEEVNDVLMSVDAPMVSRMTIAIVCRNIIRCRIRPFITVRSI